MAINVDRPVLDCVISNMEEIQPQYDASCSSDLSHHRPVDVKDAAKRQESFSYWPHLHAHTKHDHAYISECVELVSCASSPPYH